MFVVIMFDAPGDIKNQDQQDQDQANYDVAGMKADQGIERRSE